MHDDLLAGFTADTGTDGSWDDVHEWARSERIPFFWLWELVTQDDSEDGKAA